MRGASSVIHEELRRASVLASNRVETNVVDALNRHGAGENFQHPAGGPIARDRISAPGLNRGFDAHRDISARPIGSLRFHGPQAESTFGVELRAKRIAAYVVGGTGIFAARGRGGPFSPYTVTAHGAGVIHHDALGKEQVGHDVLKFFWRKMNRWVITPEVTIPGTHPSTTVAAALVLSRRESKQFYQDAVHRAVRRIGGDAL